jgi:hypothetical protein
VIALQLISIPLFALPSDTLVVVKVFRFDYALVKYFGIPVQAVVLSPIVTAFFLTSLAISVDFIKYPRFKILVEAAHMMINSISTIWYIPLLCASCAALET